MEQRAACASVSGCFPTGSIPGDLRFSASDRGATFSRGLAVIGIVYGALVALAQSDFKFVIGYSSVSHMGFVLLGLMTLNQIGLDGAVLQMFSARRHCRIVVRHRRPDRLRPHPHPPTGRAE